MTDFPQQLSIRITLHFPQFSAMIDHIETGKNIIVETGNKNKSTASDWYKLNYQYYEQIQLYVLILCLRGVTLCCVPHTYR